MFRVYMALSATVDMFSRLRSFTGLMGANAALFAINSGVRLYRAAVGAIPKYASPFLSEISIVGMDGTYREVMVSSTFMLSRGGLASLEKAGDDADADASDNSVDLVSNADLVLLRYWDALAQRYVDRVVSGKEFATIVVGTSFPDAVPGIEATVSTGHDILSVSNRAGDILTDRVVLGDLVRAKATGDAVSAVLKKRDSNAERLTVCDACMDFYRLDCDARLGEPLPEMA